MSAGADAEETRKQEAFVVYLETIDKKLQLCGSVYVREQAYCLTFERAAPELWAGKELDFRKICSAKVKLLAETIDKHMHAEIEQKQQELLQSIDRSKYDTTVHCEQFIKAQALPKYDTPQTGLQHAGQQFVDSRACYNLKESVELIEKRGNKKANFSGDQCNKTKNAILTVELLFFLK